MNSFITYLLHSSVMLVVLYAVYWLFLRKETFFLVNRIYLLLTVSLSLLLPLFEFRVLQHITPTSMTILLEAVTISPEKVGKAVTAHISGFEMVSMIYFAGLAIFLLRLIFKFVQIWIIVKRNKIIRKEGLNIVFVDRNFSPFSLFRLVFIRNEYIEDGRLSPVLAHEKVHIRQYHTFDLLLTEFVIILQWFNPVAWLLERSIKGIHEFLADDGVLKEGFGENEYHSLILSESMGLQINNLANNFNVLLIKNRIYMMTKARSATWAPVKVLFALPAILAVLFFFSQGSMNPVSAQEKTTKEVKKTTPAEKESKEVFTMVEDMPAYVGGQEAMMSFLAGNIKYPEAAMKKDIQGKVYVTFVVEADGSVTNVKVLRGIGSGCDEEAVRVVKMMPKWNPGKQAGKAVRVQYNLPIRFALDKDEKKTEKPAK